MGFSSLLRINVVWEGSYPPYKQITGEDQFRCVFALGLYLN
jgi:hypothetical protein